MVEPSTNNGVCCLKLGVNLRVSSPGNPTCACRWGWLSFEHMFEESITPKAKVIAPEGEPTEFIYQGRKFHIHAVVSRWRESGGWWNRISDGNSRLSSRASDREILDSLDDGARAIWRVEAAPEGALTTFEIELDEITNSWLIRPTSRPR